MVAHIFITLHSDRGITVKFMKLRVKFNLLERPTSSIDLFVIKEKAGPIPADCRGRWINVMQMCSECKT